MSNMTIIQFVLALIILGLLYKRMISREGPGRAGRGIRASIVPFGPGFGDAAYSFRIFKS